MTQSKLLTAVIIVASSAALGGKEMQPIGAIPAAKAATAGTESVSPIVSGLVPVSETIVPPAPTSPNLDHIRAPLDPAFATRIEKARIRLDALVRAQGDADTQPADAIQVSATEAAERSLAETRLKAEEIAWRLQQMRLYYDEISVQGIRLPQQTMLYEVDQQRGLHERQQHPVTTIEVSMQLAYATQKKTTYVSFDSTELAPGENLEAGQTFLLIGILRSPNTRRVLAWVLGRGQVILADSDIEFIKGE